MIRTILFLSAFAVASEASASSQLKRYVERQARWVGVEITSVDSLSNIQLYAIKAVLDGRNDTTLSQRNQIRAIISRSGFRFGL